MDTMPLDRKALLASAAILAFALADRATAGLLGSEPLTSAFAGEGSGVGPQAKTLADHHFFETLVRVHRAGEGAPYTGLKPAGREYVEAYVPYIHYVERLWQDATGAAHGHHAEPAAHAVHEH